jgi:transcriptional regulator of acetoin/glycerol metabolism
MQRLIVYDWPGNVREFKSAIEAAVIRCQGVVIQLEDLPAAIAIPAAAHTPTVGPRQGKDLLKPRQASSPERQPKGVGRPAWDDPRQEKRQQVLEALQRTGGNRTAAAQLLGISRSTLYLWMKELGLESTTDSID